MSNKFLPYNFRSSFLLFLFSCLISCNKFLSEKNKKSLAIPNSIADLQAIIDDFAFVNNKRAGVGVLGGDEYYVPLSTFNGFLYDQNRNLYKWEGDDWFRLLNGWSNSYDNVYRANTVLEGCEKINSASVNDLSLANVKGQALFLRGASFFEVVSGWAAVYDSKNSENILGIPLRLSTDFNIKSKRSNLKESYERIILDLKNSIPLLPDKPVHVYRASKPAACGELARVYLSMKMYDSCLVYVDKALNLFNNLIDYNDLDTGKQYPIERFNQEVIYQTQMSFQFTPYRAVDSGIISLYGKYDLRKSVFFNKTSNGIFSFQSYNGSFGCFGGIAADELYLMRAESLARLGNDELALDDLNYLLSKRYAAGRFIPYIMQEPNLVLNLILKERKKELLFRGLRLMDIKRLNSEGYNISVQRRLGDQAFIIQPGSLKFIMKIPKNVIDISGMEQNPS